MTLRLVEKPLDSRRPPCPPCPRRLEVRIAVSSGRLPYGRSRPFRLRETDLDELIAHAGRLESRR